MSVYCLNFECTCKRCDKHPDRAETDREARYSDRFENSLLCIKPKNEFAQKTARVLSGEEVPVPTESEEQQWLYQWVKSNMGAYPELEALYHIPNEGKRSKTEGAKLKREGLKDGVSDNCLPVRRGKYGSLYIELKRIKGSKVSKDQKEWIDLMRKVGNAAFICYGWIEAKEKIEWYLNLKNDEE